jgi:copper resistance protein C
MRSRNQQVCGLILLFVVLISSWASGHAILAESTPKQDAVLADAPKEAVLRFNARIEKKMTAVTLVDADGKKLPMPPIPADPNGAPDKMVVPLPEMKPGAYELQFRVMATDGHSTAGELRFTISGPTTSPATQPSGGATR